VLPFDDAFIVNPNHEALLSSPSMMIGMHPDQATESLVDYALKHEVPFAVVPCCVFMRELGGHRTVKMLREVDNEQLEDDEPRVVASYEEFLDYLQEKDPRIQRHFLPFRGRNCVLSICRFNVL